MLDLVLTDMEAVISCEVLPEIADHSLVRTTMQLSVAVETPVEGGCWDFRRADSAGPFFLFFFFLLLPESYNNSRPQSGSHVAAQEGTTVQTVHCHVTHNGLALVQEFAPFWQGIGPVVQRCTSTPSGARSESVESGHRNESCPTVHNGSCWLSSLKCWCRASVTIGQLLQELQRFPTPSTTRLATQDL